MSSASWRRWLADLAAEFGARLERTNGGHFALVHPVDGWRVVTSSTPSDRRSVQHTRAQVRREVAFARWMPRVEP